MRASSRAGSVGPWAISLAPAVVLMLTLAACTAISVDGLRLEGTRWTAVSIAGQPPIEGWEQTLIFEGGSVHGSGGCNGYTGQEPIQVAGDRVDLGDMLMTLGGCVGPGGQDLPVMAVEQLFWRMLGAVDRIAVREGRLVLSGGDGELVFERHG